MTYVDNKSAINAAAPDGFDGEVTEILKKKFLISDACGDERMAGRMATGSEVNKRVRIRYS